MTAHKRSWKGTSSYPPLCKNTKPSHSYKCQLQMFNVFLSGNEFLGTQQPMSYN